MAIETTGRYLYEAEIIIDNRQSEWDEFDFEARRFNTEIAARLWAGRQLKRHSRATYASVYQVPVVLIDGWLEDDGEYDSIDDCVWFKEG